LVADAGALAVPAANTAALAVVAALVAVAAVLPLAYLTVRHPSRLAGGANAVVVGGFALPGLVVALALAFWTLQAPWPLAALYQTQALLVFAYLVHFGSQALRASQVAVAAIPGRLDDAARILGAGRLRRLRTVELPLAAPGLLAGAGLVLLSTMKELPATLLLAPPGFETLATRIWNATEDAFLADASLAALALLLLSGVLTWFLVVRRGDAPT
jgi:iron(III) transport system permease protein